jgi:hypothetical protein
MTQSTADVKARQSPQAGRLRKPKTLLAVPVRRDDGSGSATDHRVSPSSGCAPMTIGSVLQESGQTSTLDSLLHSGIWRVVAGDRAVDKGGDSRGVFASK